MLLKNRLNARLDDAVSIMDDMPYKQVFIEYDNGFMALPDLDDVTILEALHRKFTVLAGELSVNQSKLYDEDLNIHIIYYEEGYHTSQYKIG